MIVLPLPTPFVAPHRRSPATAALAPAGSLARRRLGGLGLVEVFAVVAVLVAITARCRLLRGVGHAARAEHVDVLRGAGDEVAKTRGAMRVRGGARIAHAKAARAQLGEVGERLSGVLLEGPIRELLERGQRNTSCEARARRDERCTITCRQGWARKSGFGE